MKHFTLNKRVSVLIISIFSFCTLSFGQLKSNIEYSGFFDSYYWRGPINFSVGGIVPLYAGDLCGGLGCNKISPGFTFGVGYKLWPRVQFGADFSFINLGSSDENEVRNISFNSSVRELYLYGRYYFREDIIHRHHQIGVKPKLLKPYFVLGIAPINYSVTATRPFNEEIVDVSERTGGFSLAIPAGLGLNVVFSHRIQLLFEAKLRYTLTDYIDGIKEQGNPNSNDYYGSFDVKLQFAPTAKRLKPKRVKMKEGLPSGLGQRVVEPSVPKPKEEKNNYNYNNDDELPDYYLDEDDDDKDDSDDDDLEDIDTKPKEEKKPADSGGWDDGW